MSDESESPLERRLQQGIEEVEARIKELTQEKHALQRQLMKARRERSGLKDVNRKNSVNRVMIESRILRALEESPKPLSSKVLYMEARHVDFSLKNNTFRTHLHRMKIKKLIKPASKSGYWAITEKPAFEVTILD